MIGFTARWAGGELRPEVIGGGWDLTRGGGRGDHEVAAQGEHRAHLEHQDIIARLGVSRPGRGDGPVGVVVDVGHSVASGGGVGRGGSG